MRCVPVNGMALYCSCLSSILPSTCKSVSIQPTTIVERTTERRTAEEHREAEVSSGEVQGSRRDAGE
jgi:hypothetical protein